MLIRVLLFQLILCVICRVEQAHGNLKCILQTSMGDLSSHVGMQSTISLSSNIMRIRRRSR